MKKYQFTGHLTPLPPGIRLPLELSGEVYLVSEVEQELKRIRIAHQRELIELRETLSRTRRSCYRNRKPKQPVAA